MSLINHFVSFSAGTDWRVIKDHLKAPISLSIYNNYIYWFDVQDKVIMRVNKNSNSSMSSAGVATIQSDINDIINLLVFHPSRQNPQG